MNGGARVRQLQSARSLWPDTWRLQLPLDDWCRLVLLYHAVKHVTDGTDPCDTPQMGAKRTTNVTSNLCTYQLLYLWLYQTAHCGTHRRGTHTYISHHRGKHLSRMHIYDGKGTRDEKLPRHQENRQSHVFV